MKRKTQYALYERYNGQWLLWGHFATEAAAKARAKYYGFDYKIEVV